MSEQSVLSLLCYSMMSYGESFRSDYYRRVAYVNCKDSGVQYYIGKSADETLIAFRGTDSFRDLAHDLMFLKRVLPEGGKRNLRVHSGFIDIYRKSEVRAKVKSYVCGCGMQRVFVTGHSLGGALAILCALDLAHSGDAGEVSCVVFGAPRVGNGAFARTYNSLVKDTLRVECGNDAICKLPPSLLGYRHGGKSMHIGAPKIPLVYSFRDHSTSEYFKNLIKYEGKRVRK